MKIIIIHFHYKTPDRGGALRSWFLAQGLHDRGFDVEVITTHHANRYLKQEEPYPVHYLPVKYRNEYGSIRRILSFLKFNRLAIRHLSKLGSPDLLYCISTPLTVGLVGKKMNRNGLPFVFEVGDLWPDAPIQMGVIRNPWIKRRLYQMEESIYKASERVVALSPSIAEGVEKKVPGKKISTIPNMADVTFFGDSSTVANEIMPEYDLVIVAIGAIGKANHLEHLIKAAEFLLEEYPSVGIVIMGEGSETLRIRSLAAGLPNIRFLPFSDRNKVKMVLSSSHAVYISYRSIPILETGSPNKFFDGLAAGKLIITTFGGWIAELVEKNECGFRYDPQTPSELGDKLRPFLENEDLLKEWSSNAARLAMDFEREHLLDLLAQDLTATQVSLEVPVG